MQHTSTLTLSKKDCFITLHHTVYQDILQLLPEKIGTLSEVEAFVKNQLFRL